MAVPVAIVVDTTQRHQTLDGFGACVSGDEAKQSWWQSLYFDDLRASLMRMDLTPAFKAPYSTLDYCSPWFGEPGSLALDNNQNGPDGTRTRPYTGPADYVTAFGGCTPSIAVMGPDIDTNVQKFDFSAQANPGLIAQLGTQRASQLGDFKLYGSLWSPAPWLKVADGNTAPSNSWPLPAGGTAYPFIWGANFAGGKLDVSNTALAVFNDGTANTSALTQFGRSMAAFLRGFQNQYGVRFYAISIQNELDFEEYYNSAYYPQAAGYVAAVKAVRAQLDLYDDLKAIRIIGPEDVLGGDAYGMWQYGSGDSASDKNLQFVQAVESDATASSALAGFAVHGYSSDGATSAGAAANLWAYWANGWQTSPGSGLPANVKGVTAYQKFSWMTETSGELPEWLASSTSGGFPDKGAFSLAVGLHQALTTGAENGYIYWQLTNGSPSDDTHVETLTDATQLGNAPKYVAAKHFFRFIRPGAQRIAATVTGSTAVLASAYVQDSQGALTVVVINENTGTTPVTLTLPDGFTDSPAAYVSSSTALWVSTPATVSSGQVALSLPGYSVATFTVQSASAVTQPPGGSTDAGTPPSSGNTAVPPSVQTVLGGCQAAPWELWPLLSLLSVGSAWRASRRRRT